MSPPPAPQSASAAPAYLESGPPGYPSFCARWLLNATHAARCAARSTSPDPQAEVRTLPLILSRSRLILFAAVVDAAQIARNASSSGFGGAEFKGDEVTLRALWMYYLKYATPPTAVPIYAKTAPVPGTATAAAAAASPEPRVRADSMSGSGPAAHLLEGIYPQGIKQDPLHMGSPAAVSTAPPHASASALAASVSGKGAAGAGEEDAALESDDWHRLVDAWERLMRDLMTIAADDEHRAHSAAHAAAHAARTHAGAAAATPGQRPSLPAVGAGVVARVNPSLGPASLDSPDIARLPWTPWVSDLFDCVVDLGKFPLTVQGSLDNMYVGLALRSAFNWGATALDQHLFRKTQARRVLEFQVFRKESAAITKSGSGSAAELIRGANRRLVDRLVR